jgi:IS1 family transposase
MWSNNPSPAVVVSRLKARLPPYCPNEKCRWHDPEIAAREGRFHGHGSRPIARFPYKSPRFFCTKCRRAFTISFFDLSYRDRVKDTYEEIFDLRIGAATKAYIARLLGVSRSTVEQRLIKLSRWCLLRMAKDQDELTIKESVAYDGLENFSFSQYDPNNINHVVGRESYYCYDLNFAPLNRKGRMSHRQKRRLKAIEEKCFRYPGNAIETSSLRVLSRVLEKSEGNLELHTDNHYAYRRALQKTSGCKLTHVITSSKITRNYRNRLFAINHMDMLSRHHLSDFKRETIAFAKTSISMVESFLLLAAYKNYMRTCFLKPNKVDPLASQQSPAMRVGVSKKVLSFRDFFSTRITKHQLKLNEDWLLFFERKDPFSRRPIRAYTGI